MTTTQLPQRADYMAGRVTHEEFYRSVVREAGINWANHPMLPKIREALLRGDEHLNSIGLAWWDMHGSSPWIRSSVQRSLKAHGDFLSMAGIVCVLKTAAKMAAEDCN